MPYRVRSEGGEVKFESLYEIQRAIAVGLVSPTDELTEAGTENWRKCNSLPALKDAKLESKAESGTGRWIFSVVALAVLALVLIFTKRLSYWGLGLAALVALALPQITLKMSQKRRVR